jgi:hypothetical protein
LEKFAFFEEETVLTKCCHLIQAFDTTVRMWMWYEEG